MTKTVDDYLKYVTMWHKRNAPKFMAVLEKSLQPIVDNLNFIENIPSYFDLDTAIGVQLDVVGQWINLPRKFNVPIPDPWFTWGDSKHGWGAGLWYQPFDYEYLATFLDDDTYRSILRSRIKANQWDDTVYEIRTILDSFFPYADAEIELIVDDKQTMEFAVAMTNWIPSPLLLEIFRGDYLPLNPAGVRSYHLVTSVQDTQIFGWGVDNTKIGGWGTGAWGVDPMYLIDRPPGEIYNPPPPEE